jgi:hypothetical protein
LHKSLDKKVMAATTKVASTIDNKQLKEEEK